MVDSCPGGRTAPVVVITGASAGVGRATAIMFAEQGAAVALLSRGRAGLRGAADDARVAGAAGVLPLVVDVADAEAVDDAAAEVERQLGPISVWVNNAMVTVFASAHDLTPDEIKRVTLVTYLGQVHGTLAALHRMRPRNEGVIVNVSSALAYRAIPLQAAYCAAKFAVRGFTEALRTELLADGSNVAVTLVHLPALNTPQFGWCRTKVPGVHPHPVPPIYQPEVAARAIVAAASRPARQRTVGSWNRMILKANAVAPGVLDHFLARTGHGSQVARGLRPDPADDLFVPEDDREGSDRGVRGRFGNQAHGVLAGAFVGSLPTLALDLAAASWSRGREVLGQHISARWRRLHGRPLLSSAEHLPRRAEPLGSSSRSRLAVSYVGSATPVTRSSGPPGQLANSS